MAVYDFLVFIHIVSAIVGVGPGFILTVVVKKPTTMTELKHAYQIRRRLHVFVMVGGLLVFVSGLWMGILQPALFKQGWYSISITLFILVLIAGPMLLAPRSKPIKELLATSTTEDIPPEYDLLAKALFFYERVTNIILFVIILLMVMKPF